MSEDKTQQIIDELLKEYPIFEQLEFNEFTMDETSRGEVAMELFFNKVEK